MGKNKIILGVFCFVFLMLQVFIVFIGYKILAELKEVHVVQKENVLVLAKNELTINTTENYKKLLSSNKELHNMQDNTLSKANTILLNTNTHISQAHTIKQTYDAILDEQKKKTVDTSKVDSTIEKMKTNALLLYDTKDYLGAYYQFKNILIYEVSDLKTRAYKTKALYYSNPANKSNYNEILEDMKMLFVSEEWDLELEDIRDIIKIEKGEKYE